MTGPRAPVRAVRAVVLADDSRVRRAMAGLLRAAGDIEIVVDRRMEDVDSEPGTGVSPELIVIELGERDLENASRLIGRVRLRYRRATVIVVGDPALARRVMEAGADEYVSRLESPECLASAIRSVRALNTWPRGEDFGRARLID